MSILNTLSERELEILSLVAMGKSNKEIGLELYISPNTVKVHLRNIFAKLEVSSRTEATLFAVRAGMVEGVAETKPNGVAPSHRDREEPSADKLSPRMEEPFIPQPERIPAPPKWWQHPWILAGLIVLFLLMGAGLSRLLPSFASTPQEVIISPGENRWEVKAELPSARFGQAVVVFENQILMVGGETLEGISSLVESYNPESNLWTALSSKPTAVTDIQAAILGGKIYVPGGRTTSDEATNILEIYDPTENTWEVGASVPFDVSAYALIAFEGKLYLFGGWDGDKYSNRVFAYDPNLDAWTEKTPLPTVRAFASAVVASNKIFIMGGFDGKEALVSNLVYNPGNDQNGKSPWDTAAPLPTGRYAMGGTFIGDKVYILGGIQDDKTPAPQLIFLPDSNGWIVRPDPDGAGNPTWSHFGIAVVRSNVYALGGMVDGIPSQQNITFQAIYTIPLPVIIK